MNFNSNEPSVLADIADNDNDKIVAVAMSSQANSNQLMEPDATRILLDAECRLTPANHGTLLLGTPSDEIRTCQSH